MSGGHGDEGRGALPTLAMAVADIAVGGVLIQHVSLPVGFFLMVIGVLVLLTVTYRATRRRDGPPSRERQPA